MRSLRLGFLSHSATDIRAKQFFSVGPPVHGRTLAPWLDASGTAPVTWTKHASRYYHMSPAGQTAPSSESQTEIRGG